MKSLMLKGVQFPRHKKSSSEHTSQSLLSKQLTFPPLTSLQNSLPIDSTLQLPSQSATDYPQYHRELKSTQKKLAYLQGRSRLIQNHYKKNLKLAFEEKIKTYRLQSYLDRKDEQQMLMAEIERRERELLEEKARKVEEVKLSKAIAREIVQSRLTERTHRAKLQSRSAKHENDETIRQRVSEMHISNRRTRDQIRTEQQQQKERRDLLIKLAEMRRKELHALQVKKQLQDIIKKQDYLASLKEQLLSLTQPDPQG